MSSRQAFQDLDRNIAANLRIYREDRGLSQEELAQRMTDLGFGFSQATIWKIERGQRPVKLSEAAALADALGILTLSYLTSDPEVSSHRARLESANRAAYDAYGALKAAAAAYIEAQFGLLIAAREAHDAGVTVSEWRTTWLGTPAERAVIEARTEIDQHDEIGRRIDEAVDQVLQALRDHGYMPQLRLEDLEIEGGPSPARIPK